MATDDKQTPKDEAPKAEAKKAPETMEAFIKRKGLDAAEETLLRRIMLARVEGTQVPSSAYNSIPDDRVAFVAGASDEFAAKS